MTEYTTQPEIIASDNADIGAAALRRVEAVEAALLDAIDGRKPQAVQAARRLLATKWMPEREVSRG